MAMVVDLLMHVLMRMSVRMNLNDGLNMRMCVSMLVGMVVTMLMMVRDGIVMVVSPHAVFDPKLTVLAAITRHA